MTGLSDLAELLRPWETSLETPDKWVGRSASPSILALEQLRSLQKATGSMLQMQFVCRGTRLFTLTSSDAVDTDTAISFFTEANLSETEDLCTLCLKVSDAVAGNKPSSRLAQHLHDLCTLADRASLDSQVLISIDKRALSNQVRFGGWEVTVWFAETAFMTWLCSKPIEDMFSFFGNQPPAMVVVPAHRSGCPSWIVTPEEIGSQQERLLKLSTELHQRRQQRAAELSLRSKGPVVLPEILDGASPEWLAETAPFGSLTGYALLTTVASDYELDNHRLLHMLSNRDRMVTAEFVFWPDRLQLDTGENVPVGPDKIATWLSFLAYYRQTREEAKRYSAVWQAALERVAARSTATILTDPERLISVFQALRDTLLDENLEKALGAAEKAESILGQLAAQFSGDVESLGNDAERLAVASITSGVVGLSGAVFKADAFSFVGPVATAFVFLWYFPLVFRRLSYLRSSIGRRANDFQYALGAIRHTAGDFVEGELYISRFDEHRKAVLAEVASIEGRMLRTLVVLHVIAVGVPAYLALLSGMSAALWVSAVAVFAYTVWIALDAALPRSTRILVVVLTLFLTVIALAGLEPIATHLTPWLLPVQPVQ